jgi:Sulfotransferase family
MQDRLLFVIGSPRSGSTLLNRMLGASPDVYAPPEPHLLTPLAHLGYFASVERAPYDPVITRAAARELVKQLPSGEADYLAALRAYTDSVYARLLAPSGRRMLLDKTPAYALVLDFLTRLYPEARYVVLTRHPMAVWASVVESFFDGDQEAAHRHNPLLERYVPAIARFLRERPVPLHHVRYEELVRDPEAEMQRICTFAGLAFDSRMVDYGSAGSGRSDAPRGLGDPITVARESRPTTRSLDKWARDWAGQPEKVEQGHRILARLLDEDLETWGFTRAGIEAELDAVDAAPAARRSGARLTRYRLERRALVLARRRIQQRGLLERLVRQLREACDVLLR